MDQKKPEPVGKEALVFASAQEMKQAGEAVGKCGCKLTRVEGGLKMIDCALHEHAQEMLAVLRNLEGWLAGADPNSPDGGKLRMIRAVIKKTEKKT